jgi:hypothetical protein
LRRIARSEQEALVLLGLVVLPQLTIRALAVPLLREQDVRPPRRELVVLRLIIESRILVARRIVPERELLRLLLAAIDGNDLQLRLVRPKPGRLVERGVFDLLRRHGCDFGDQVRRLEQFTQQQGMTDGIRQRRWGHQQAQPKHEQSASQQVSSHGNLQGHFQPARRLSRQLDDIAGPMVLPF